MSQPTKTKRSELPAAQRCAAQHFGPWAVKGDWMAQAVAAIKDGTYKAEKAEHHQALSPSSPAPYTGPSNNHVTETTGNETYTLYWIEDGIARIPMFGQVTKGDSCFGGFSSVRSRRAIRRAMADDRVEAIVLHIDSPGGTVSGTGDLAEDVRAANEVKPVVAFIEDLGASAAYWIASQASRIVATPTATIGSIGTMTYLYDTSGAMAKEGVRPILVSTGKFKGAWIDGLPVTDEYVQTIQTEVDDLNEHFLAGVMSGRAMKREQLEAIADGRCFIADKAKQLGLIDEVSSYDALVEGLIKETQTMDRSKFDALKNENPDWIADETAQAKRASHADARKELKDMLAAFPGREAFAAAQFAAGRTIDEAKATDELIQSETAALTAKAQADAKEITRLKALAGTQDAIDTGANAADAGKQGTDDFENIADPKARAQAEWKADAGECQSKFTSEKVYVAYRKHELVGKITLNKMTKSAA